jgi:hypothetical protein
MRKTMTTVAKKKSPAEAAVRVVVAEVFPSQPEQGEHDAASING